MPEPIVLAWGTIIFLAVIANGYIYLIRRPKRRRSQKDLKRDLLS